ncbi:aldehyde dehydrogenase family protein [Sphingomonas sp. NIBR02145]|uniref:aldehyde dehydrogenase family protein n=1 Tax=Sphingomonas sp. NIBR02145 TaxID=3014784 RepID=UPI0022B43E39|nr:aldehyde dehydrogenase family protein [Sphingomonas sp. NIBR02145]WHU04282.1 aldehyde dehydrogenase family protein [Sphingomonas sp. NIBR02145]
MAYVTINPFTEDVVRTYSEHSDAEMEQALATSYALSKSAWANDPVDTRTPILAKLGDLLAERADDFAQFYTFAHRLKGVAEADPALFSSPEPVIGASSCRIPSPHALIGGLSPRYRDLSAMDIGETAHLPKAEPNSETAALPGSSM